MGFRSPRIQSSALLLFFVVGGISAQVPPARDILALSEAEQTKFVDATVDAGFPTDRADQMTMLIINRSGLVLPSLERRVEVELRSESPSSDLITTATEMIAYAGDEQALREISKLMAIDDGRFGRLVGRTLDNSVHFRNPFTVAYRGLELGDEAVSRHTVAWVASTLT